MWNPLWAALAGDPSSLRGRERSIVWWHFAGLPSRVTHEPDQLADFEAAVVSDLRSSTVRSIPVTRGCVDWSRTCGR
ncbi:hypothetical protein PV342_28620 [Streptomyces sp. PA03-3a]|nr:hypothetical protein [Streptomyces sp. PA03-3a]